MMKKNLYNTIYNDEIRKKNAKTGNRVHLQKQLMNFSPFDLRDTSYLDHLHTESKLRQSREAMLLLRKDMIEANKRSNYGQNN